MHMFWPIGGGVWPARYGAVALGRFRGGRVIQRIHAGLAKHRAGPRRYRCGHGKRPTPKPVAKVTVHGLLISFSARLNPAKCFRNVREGPISSFKPLLLALFCLLEPLCLVLGQCLVPVRFSAPVTTEHFVPHSPVLQLPALFQQDSKSKSLLARYSNTWTLTAKFVRCKRVSIHLWFN